MPLVIWLMRFACWINKGTNTHSNYVILIAFPRQQWQCKLAPILPYTYAAYLVHHSYVCTHQVRLIIHLTTN